MQTRTTHTTVIPFLDEVLEEAAVLEAQWDARRAEIPSWHPRNDGTDDDADDDSADDADDSDDSDDDDSDDDSADNDDSDDDRVVKVPRAEHEAMRRELAQRRRAEAKEKKKKEQETRRKKASEGRYEELLAEKDDELAEKDAEIERLKGELTTTKSRGLISSVAKRLNFDDPDIAKALYSEYEREGEDRTKEADVEGVLKRILRAKPKLKAGAPKTGGQVGGSNGNGKLSYEDIQQMSQEEISRRYHDADFQAALEAGPAT